MVKRIFTLTLIVIISGSAAYSLSSLRFFEKLGMAFHETGPRTQRGPIDQGQEPPERSGRPGGHGAHSIPLSKGLLQVGAYFAVFAFVAMVTYYAERTLRKKPLAEKNNAVPLQNKYSCSE
jgi:hypothetical protein